MCGRYVLYETDKLAERFKAKPDKLVVKSGGYNLAPGQFLPVVTNRDGSSELNLMRWGLIPKWAKEPSIGYKLINARAESVFDKPAWRGPVRRHRCLVPANGFYEWQAGKDGKQPYYIHPLGSDLFAFAGIFDSWNNPASGEVIETFSILTSEPNDQMRPIHNRMPVILPREQENRWLDVELDSPDELADLLTPYEGKLAIERISKDVNNAHHDDASLIVALP